MPIESVTDIADLDPDNPTTTDAISEGDNHIRNIKTALKNNFGSIGGTVTADHTDLNRCDITTEGTPEASKVVTTDTNNVVSSLKVNGLSTEFNVKYYGATGDGTTDDSAAIQAALDAANAAGGGTVYFPPGTYRKLDTTSKLVMYSNTRILGDGWSSIILHDDTDVNARKDLIEAINRTNIEFENICFDGTWDTYPNQTNQSQCLVVQDTTGVRLTNVKFTRLRYMACPFTNVRNVTVTGCYLDQIARDGIRCVNSQNVVIDGNNFRNVADDVIALHVNDSDGTPTHAHGFIISNNTFEQCQGIKALGAKQLTITGNVFKRTIRNPILVTHSTGATEGDTTPWGVSITNNTFIDTFSDYGTVYVIRIETPERASAAQPIPGYPHTGTGVGNAPYSDFYTNELDTTVLGMYHTVISGNTIMRTLHATTNFSDYGFDTLLFDRVAPIGPGFGDPAINDTSFNCHHIHLIGNLRGVLIKGNTLSGIRSSTNAIAFSDPGTALTNGYENVSIESNLFFDVTGSAIVFSSAFNTITLDVTIKNNDFNLDPFHVDTDRAANGTWSAVNATQCVALNGCDGVTFSGNKIRNAARVADSVSNFSVKHRNLVYADFSSGGAGDNANNAGVRDIPASYPEFVIISYDADPTSGTFGEVSNNELLEASAAMPSTGSYVASHFVRNETPTVTGTGGSQYVVSGWIRITTNSAHVLNTDWVEARTLTGT